MWNKDKEEAVQYIVAIAMIIFGMILCMMGFWVDPTGIISNSVLTALGEILLLVGGIFNLNLPFRHREMMYGSNVEKRLKDLEDKMK